MPDQIYTNAEEKLNGPQDAIVSRQTVSRGFREGLLWKRNGGKKLAVKGKVEVRAYRPKIRAEWKALT